MLTYYKLLLVIANAAIVASFAVIVFILQYSCNFLSNGVAAPDSPFLQ